jgi:hypothetical protein
MKYNRKNKLVFASFVAVVGKLRTKLGVGAKLLPNKG